MKHTVYYVNSAGDTLDFTAGLFDSDGNINPYRLKTGDFMNYRRDYNSSDDYRLRGGKITAFKRSITEYPLDLDVLAATEATYIQAINRLHDVADYDVACLKPGTLYVDGSYLNCYIIESQKEDWESPVLFLSVSLTVVAERPIWWSENTISFEVVEEDSSGAFPDEFVLEDSVGEETDDGYGGIAGDFPLEWAYDSPTTRNIENSAAYKSSYFILTIYGAVDSPSVIINGVNHCVYTEVLSSEALIINSYERTAIKRNMHSGTETNVFGDRGESLFDEIPAGLLSVSYSGDFAFDLTILTERSEPLWVVEEV